jgi:peptidyl-prolyl cis-trans isomerase C
MSSTPAPNDLIAADGGLQPDPFPLINWRTDVRHEPKQERSIATRKLILDAARSLANENGINGVTMQLVSQRAGIASGTFKKDEARKQGGERSQKLIAEQVSKLPPDLGPLVQAQMELARQSVLTQAWQQQTVQSKEISEEDLRIEYERQVKLLGPKQYRLRHILVNEEDTAKLLLERLRSGGKLADLAAEYSRDEATRGSGGLTDWMAQGEMLPVLLKAVESLKPGQLAAAPVRGAAGWHVVALEDSRAFTPPARDTLKPQLQRAIVQQRLQAAVETMRSSAKVE